MREHAILSASSAFRWLACTPSARLEEHYPDRAGESAKEGTFAHRLAELKLDRYSKAIGQTKYDLQVKILKEGKSQLGDYYSKDMESYVDEYVDLVIEKYEHAKEVDPEAVLMLEQRLDFSDWVPEGFGRGDAIVLYEGHLEIIDLKYGRNVPVSAIGNPQIRLYGLGAYHLLGSIYDVDTVTMTIMQPRNGGESSETLTSGELLEWAYQIHQTAQVAFEGKGELNPGPHCQFCRAAVRCRALTAQQLELAKHDFQDADQLSDEEVTDVLSRVDTLVSWANKIKAYALTEALDHGKHWPGWKLVAGRSNRKISDPDEAKERLLTEGYPEAQICKPQELKTLTQLEKSLGKQDVAEVLEGLIIKPCGKPTLVPEDDPRPAFNSAAEDFTAL